MEGGWKTPPPPPSATTRQKSPVLIGLRGTNRLGLIDIVEHLGLCPTLTLNGLTLTLDGLTLTLDGLTLDGLLQWTTWLAHLRTFYRDPLRPYLC